MISCIEFYKTPEGAVMYKRVGDAVCELTMGDRRMVCGLLDLIRSRYPDAFTALSREYSVNEPNRLLYEWRIVSRFIRCNCGEYDANTMDIDADGFFRFEEVGCPLRGECRLEGVVCKPCMDTSLTERESDVLSHIARGEHSDEIAAALYISPLTVNRHRENIKAKLGLRTIAQLVSFYHEHLRGRE